MGGSRPSLLPWPFSQRSDGLNTRMDAQPSKTPSLGVLLVDHGSKIESANESLAALAELIGAGSRYHAVRHAHMELASPNIDEGFDQLVAEGVGRIIVVPYFLALGRHASRDIPRLCLQAAERHTGLDWVLAEPIGTSPEIAAIVNERIHAALTVV
jgi:sirohydrochlorin ferrochelatase